MPVTILLPAVAEHIRVESERSRFFRTAPATFYLHELAERAGNRAFEIQLFWQRSNYFLVLMTALGVGAFAIEDGTFALVVSLFATIASFLWIRTNLGSKFWQESWEAEVVMLAREHHIRSFERSTSEITEQVRAALHGAQQAEERSFARRWIDHLVTKKYSVTSHMIILSFASTLVWLFVTGVFAVRLVSRFCHVANGCIICSASP